MTLESSNSFKIQRIQSGLRGYRRILVGLSGGVDSAVLLVLAVRALGREGVVAVTARSESLAEDDLESARGVARQVGVDLEIVATRELDRSAYRRNAGDRCFHCRSELFDVLSRLAGERGCDAVAYGAIADDRPEDRPGMRAAEDRGILAPLAEVGLGKEEVRAIAREAGLAVHDRPAGACLASRIPVGSEVTETKLRQIERAERALRALGFVQVRVRHHGEAARLELDRDGNRRIGEDGVREAVVREVRAAGFRFVWLDLEGYRTGSAAAPGAYLLDITR